MTDFFAAAKDLLPETIELRRKLHRSPEVGNDIPITRGIVLEALEGLPLELNLHETTSGIAAVLRGGKPGGTILMRGDMDGLPMPEDTGLEFASEHEGRMHACGHDLHTSMLVGAAKLLSSMQDEIPGTIVFMFQPGEEGHAGAKFMIEEGLLETTGERPDAAFAIHVSTWFPSGVVTLKPGPALASADEVRIEVKGRGGHASSPFLSLDPIPIAAEIVLAVETAITRRINVFDPGVITFGSIQAGTTNNVIPEQAVLIGTIRAFSEETRAELHAILERVATNVAAAHTAEATVHIKPGYPVTINDSDFTAMVSATAEELFGEDMVEEMESPIMGAEDWSYVLNEVPGAMAFLGSCPPDLEPGNSPGNHSNLVVFDEDSMITGIALYAAVALKQLGS
jgi:hippurate hydrolase